MFLKLSWTKLAKALRRAPKLLSLFLIGFYKLYLSGFLGMGGCCRFYPSCSDYALLAYKNLPFWQATAAALRRLLSCRPFGPADPGDIWLPEKKPAPSARRRERF